MKRFLILLSILCFGAYADTITINWGIDNQPYTTTTCEIGGDVILPSVSKRGHIFRGWQAEHFDRGTFADWDSVPTNTNSYLSDRYESNIPKQGDYMLVFDASDYATINFVARQANIGNDYYKDVTVTYKGKVYTYNHIKQNNQDVFILGGIIKIKSPNNNWQYVALQDIEYNNTVYHTGDVFFSRGSWWFTDLTVKVSLYSESRIYGRWRFVYDGVWEVDGKAGWKPDVQISNE